MITSRDDASAEPQPCSPQARRGIRTARRYAASVLGAAQRDHLGLIGAADRGGMTRIELRERWRIDRGNERNL